VFLGAFENHFLAAWGDIEIANIEVWREVGEFALDACIEVDEPEILVFNFAL